MATEPAEGAGPRFGEQGGLLTYGDYLRLADHPKRGHHFIQEAILALALVGGYVALLSAPFPVAVKLAWIFVLSALAAFRSFRLAGEPLTPRRAFLFSLLVAQVATFFAWALCGLDLHFSRPREIAVIGPPAGELARSALAGFDPNAVVAFGPSDAVPLLEGKDYVAGQPAVYVCENFACQAPITRKEEALPRL